MSILPRVSKIFRKLLWKQIDGCIYNFWNPYLHDYSRRVGTQLALLSLIENYKKVLDNKGFRGAVLMDFIKALDTIKHDLLIAKLHAFNFDNSNLKPPCSYLNDRWLTTKIGPNFILLGSWRICPWSIPFLYFCFKRFIVLLSVLICAT